MLPKKIDLFLRFIRALKDSFSSYLYDFIRFSKFSIQNTYPTDKIHLQSKIISLYHVIEKGLIMPKPRLGFGKDRIELLIKLLKLYDYKYISSNNIHFNSSIKVLKSYVDLHQNSKINTNYIKDFLDLYPTDKNINGGYFNLDLNIFNKKSKGNFSELCEARNSMRNFSNEPVCENDIKDAIKLAQLSPSTCNRQSSRVYIINDKIVMEKVLKLQAGSRGFSEKIDKLLMICYDIKSYQGSGDRNSGYIDSSLFAMSLIYALTFKGIGTISLNWSKSKESDIQIRKIINIRKSHNIIFFIGLGNLNKTTKVAVSTRHNIDDILIEI